MSERGGQDVPGSADLLALYNRKRALKSKYEKKDDLAKELETRSWSAFWVLLRLTNFSAVQFRSLLFPYTYFTTITTIIRIRPNFRGPSILSLLLIIIIVSCLP